MNKKVPEEFPIDDKLILRLITFTHWYVRGRGWFRGAEAITFNAGKMAEDYVFEAIKKYLENPNGFDPSLGTFESYLKYNLIRTLVFNDIKSSENRRGFGGEVSADYFGDNEEVSANYSDLVVPQVEALFEQEMDYNLILQEIEEEVSQDEIVANIYLGLRVNGSKPKQIMEEFGMTAGEYNNGFRRLTTILNNIAKKYSIEKPKVRAIKKL